MAKTYQNIELLIDNIFTDIVATVSDNLASETSLSIPQVSFKAETFKELCARLKEDSSTEATKQTKYPLVALIRNYGTDLKPNDYYKHTSLTLIIVTLTEPTKHSEDRMAENYIPVLYPIYTELMEQIKRCKYIATVGRPYPPHKLDESFNLGSDAGYRMEDYVDGLIISNLELKFNPNISSQTITGKPAQVMYVNSVEEILLRYDNDLVVDLLSHNTVDILGVGGAMVYSIYTSHDDTTRMVTFASAESVNIDTATKGDYYGYVKAYDGVTNSELCFHYSIDASGNVTRFTSYNLFRLHNFNVSIFDFNAYPFDVETQTVSSSTDITLVDIEADTVGKVKTFTFTPKVANTQVNEVTVSGIQTETMVAVTLTNEFQGAASKTTSMQSFSYIKINKL